MWRYVVIQCCWVYHIQRYHLDHGIVITQITQKVRKKIKAIMHVA